MSKETVWYRCLTHCEVSFFEFTPCHREFDRWMAQEAARDYHDWRDANWPLVFSLHETQHGPELARFEVNRHMEPVFYAAAIAKATGGDNA